MKKRVLLILVAMMTVATAMSQNYDFFATAPSGQTLYYKIVNGEAQVTSQNSGSPYYLTYPIGTLSIPSSVTYNGTTYPVTSIGARTFYNCTGLTSVSIPNSVTSVGYSALYGCTGLISVTIPASIDTIEGYAFWNCNALNVVNYGGTIDQWCRIGFYGSSSNPIFYSHSLNINGTPVTNLIIPNSVTDIKKYAFCGFANLISVTIPNSVIRIGSSAFYDCLGLTSITIPNSVISMGGGVFRGCTGLTSVTIPNSVTVIGDDAFYDCTSLTSVTIPNSVTSIGGYAFYNCMGLTSVTIPNSVISIGDQAFSRVKHIIYNGTATGSPWGALSTQYNFVDGDFVFSNNNKQNVLAYIGIGGIVTIPNSVTRIGSGAFSGCSGLMSVTIPNSVTVIGDGAFEACNGLTSVTIPNSVTT